MEVAKLRTGFKDFVVFAVCILLFIAMFILSVACLVSTSDMNMNNAVLENIDYLKDNIFVNIVVLLLSVALIVLLRPLLDKLRRRYLYLALFLWTAVLGVIWVLSAQSSPTQDSYIVMNAAQNLANGNTSVLNDVYWRHFPYQLGYVWFNEILIGLFGVNGNFILIEEINVLFLAAAFVGLVDLSGRVFHSRSIQNITALLLAGCLPAILFCTFLYGNIVGFAFAIYALLFMVMWMQKNKLWYAAVSAVLIGLAVAVKLNNAIVLVAMCIIIFTEFVNRKKWLNLAYIAMAVVMVIGIKGIAVLQYEKRTAQDFGSGVPMISWLAMGLNEGFNGIPGWYDGSYVIINYDSSHGDNKVMKSNSDAEIKKRIQYFSANKIYGINFFYKKLTSEWNEPTYQSIWTNQVRGHYKNMGVVAAYICGNGENGVKGYMNFYQQLIFIGALFGCEYCMKKRDLCSIALPLVILGGILYHLLFEAKSQYAITYFIMMVPLAACGLECVIKLIKEMFEKKVLPRFKEKSPDTSEKLPTERQKVLKACNTCSFLFRRISLFHALRFICFSPADHRIENRL